MLFKKIVILSFLSILAFAEEEEEPIAWPEVPKSQGLSPLERKMFIDAAAEDRRLETSGIVHPNYDINMIAKGFNAPSEISIFISTLNRMGFTDGIRAEAGGQCDCCGCPGPCSQCTDRKIAICCTNSNFGGGESETEEAGIA